MIIEQNKIIQTDGKRPIVYDVYYNQNNTPKPVVLFCHGYKGFKDWGAWHLVAEEFAKAGFFFLKFNFSHNGGTAEQPIDFPDLEAFSENTYTKELEDVVRVLKELENYSQEANPTQVNIIGHSRGGGLALLASELHNNILKAATWAGVSDFAPRFYEGTEAFAQWEKTGMAYVENARTHQQLPHKFSFYEDFNANREAYSIKRAVSNTEKPLLIVHGTADTTVELFEAENLKKWAPQAKLHIIEGADHVFQSKHPWEAQTLSKEMKGAVRETIAFFLNEIKWKNT
ncbi:MAG TPA: alpha/beta fold hydrolase [Flavobacteriaceae bacterium]|nr:alpha/beta fold hydrolase [Flavobacteriaceae bacterium]